MPKTTLLSRYLKACVALLVCISTASHAEALIQGDGIEVTSNDVIAEITATPGAEPKSILIDPDKTAQIAHSIFTRKVLAQRAESAYTKDPQAVAGLQLAKERYLLNWELKRFAESVLPAADTLEKLAMTTYKANPNTYRQPEEIRVSHILIKADNPDAQVKAAQLLRDIRAGANFEELAKTHSTDPGSAAHGGDLGFITRGRTVPPFERAAFAMTTPGELTGPIESQFGYHIIRLDERRPGGIKPFEAVKANIEQNIKNKVIAQNRTALEAELRSKGKLNTAAIEALAQSQK